MKTLLSIIGVELSAVSYREKILSALGGLIAIVSLIWVTRQALGLQGAMCLIASMGASGVLLFAVPHGQLSQPWPVIAGNVFSAFVGVLCYRCIPYEGLAAGAALGISILLMHQLKCIHPPGGATALTAVLGGDAVHALGFKFVVFPVLINVLIMVGVAILFNWGFKWRRYPAALGRKNLSLKPHPLGLETSHEDIVKALRNLDSFVDITEEELLQLSRMIAREREARLLKTARQRVRSAEPEAAAS